MQKVICDVEIGDINIKLRELFRDCTEKNKTGIYKLSFSNTHKVYIGSAIQTKIYKKNKLRPGFYGRIYMHLWQLKNNIHHSPKLQNFVNKYGIKELKFEIVELCDETISEEREEYWTKFYNAVEKGFNCRYQGKKSGIILSDEAKRKIGEKNSIKMKGKTPKNIEFFRERGRRPILEYENGLFITEYESCKKAGEILGINYKTLNNVITGRAKGIKSLPNKSWKYKDNLPKRTVAGYERTHRKIIQTNYTGEIINTFSSADEASKILKITRQSIYNLCNNRSNRSTKLKSKFYYG